MSRPIIPFAVLLGLPLALPADDAPPMPARSKANAGAAVSPPSRPAASPQTLPADWETIETSSFTVRFKSNRDLAEKLAQAAEVKRAETFERWSGPPGGSWSPRCEIVLHPTADCYATMTGKPAAASGHATVRLADGKAAERRIDLRADDDGALANTLPRELTHVVL